MRVVRIYHAGRTAGHRARERALVQAGVDVTLIVPQGWTEGGAEPTLSAESFPVLELPVRRPDDVNRHVYASSEDVRAAVLAASPDVVDVHEEPFSAVMRQVLDVLPGDLPVVSYAAQNVDKRFPPPFPAWERRAFARLDAIYPCTRQAASVLRGRGYGGTIRVLPLAYDDEVFTPGAQQHDAQTWQVALVGRLVPEKGVHDALVAFGALRAVRSATLTIAGSGPLAGQIACWARDLGLSQDVVVEPWLDSAGVAELYRGSHVVLTPSRSTPRWVEQFGRMITEAQACGAVVAGYASGSIPEVGAGSVELVAEADVVGLGRALVELSALPDLWDLRRRAGLAVAAGRTWSAVAVRQAELYAAAAARPVHSRPVGRAAARAEFGPSAYLGRGIRRPHALPILRDLSVLNR